MPVIKLYKSTTFIIFFCAFISRSVLCDASDFAKKSENNNVYLVNDKFSGALSHYTMGVMYDSYGMYEEAINEYKESGSFEDNSEGRLQLRLGADYLGTGQTEKAIDTLIKAKQLMKESIAPQLILAAAFAVYGEYEKARQEYEEIIVKDPENIKALISLADLAMLQENFRKAEQIYLKILDERPDSAVLHFNFAMIYVKLNKTEKALEHLKRTIEISPGYIAAHMAIAVLYELKGDLDNAEVAYKNALKINENNSKIRTRLALIYEKKGRFEDAVTESREIIANDPYDQEGYLFLYSLYTSRGYIEKGIEVLNQAFDKNIDSPGLYRELGYGNMRGGNYRKALSYIDKGILQYPDDGYLHFYRGIVLEKIKDYKEAVEEFETAINLKPDFHEAYNYAGYLLAEQGIELEKAEGLIKKALEYEPESPAYLDSLGWVYYKSGRINEALKIIKEVSGKIKDPAVFEHLGDIYAKMGMHKEALNAWKESLKLKPDSDRVLQKIKIEKDLLK